MLNKVNDLVIRGKAKLITGAVAEALLGLDDYCMEYIGAYREGLFGPVK